MGKAKKNFFKLYYGATSNAGSKAKIDAETIFEKSGFTNQLQLPRFISDNQLLNSLYSPILGTIRFFKVKKNGALIFNYPSNIVKGVLLFHGIAFMNFFKKNKKIALIHDIEELRHDTAEYQWPLFYRKYCSLNSLRQYDVLIAHNEMMKNWLTNQGFSPEKIVSLELFDYLADKKNTGGIFGNDIIVAGNLSPEKVRFLEDVNSLSDLNFHLYGSGLEKSVENYTNVHYFGSFPSDLILSEIKGSYGLVWDSEGFAGDVGNYAKYQKYNNPHKVSLYLAAGFPVIMWSESALAPFVEEHGIGILIDNLADLPEKLKSISEMDYKQMKEKTLLVGEKVLSGSYLSEAIRKAEKIIWENE